MVCLACRGFTPGKLCVGCLHGLRSVPDQLLNGGIRVRSAFLHEGPARLLVHNLKYRGIEPAGDFLAEAMAGLIPPAAVVVPVPRVVWRELRYGIDPAVVLASKISRLTGSRMANALVPPWLGMSQARVSRAGRRPPDFRSVSPLTGFVVLVDDVVTTGGTVLSAWRALGGAPALVVSATSVGGRLQVATPAKN